MIDTIPGATWYAEVHCADGNHFLNVLDTLGTPKAQIVTGEPVSIVIQKTVYCREGLCGGLAIRDRLLDGIPTSQDQRPFITPCANCPNKRELTPPVASMSL